MRQLLLRRRAASSSAAAAQQGRGRLATGAPDASDEPYRRRWPLQGGLGPVLSLAHASRPSSLTGGGR